MESRLAGKDIGFDGPTDDDDVPVFSPSGFLPDPHSDPADIVSKSDYEASNERRLRSALADLDQRSRDILERRWLTDDKTTLQTLAEKYGISAERIRQLEQNAMKKLRGSIIA